MSCLKLALIGKSIAHSRSPEIYRRIIPQQIQYDLLDVDDRSRLPSIDLLKTRYNGINITAPWKDEYVSYAIAEAKKWKAVNCLRFINGFPEAMNTDATALEKLIPEMKEAHGGELWVILGDGAMSGVVATILSELGEKYQIYSRKNGDRLNQLSLLSQYKDYSKKILINACSRDFIFTNKLDGTWLFWDLNYAHSAHQVAAQSEGWRYVDGGELLETQAQHAVKFWKL